MTQFNKVIIAGNLVRDPEVVGNDKKVTKFTIANNTGFGEHSKASFIDCVAFGKKGEVIAQHFTKGKGIQVEGRLVQQNWEDKEGNNRSSFQIEVQDFVFIGGPKEKSTD